ncbi:hypothetical protein RRG08_034267 [Elysia crispata]|uniref:Uncharacterized protein n=1 Tax=Elysia crispata TaxID=231223 RepID=A0AAE1DQD4_9GAST|nr:hypothetical protein RRG08_034267 [Elysia crispata]
MDSVKNQCRNLFIPSSACHDLEAIKFCLCQSLAAKSKDNGSGGNAHSLRKAAVMTQSGEHLAPEARFGTSPLPNHCSLLLTSHLRQNGRINLISSKRRALVQSTTSVHVSAQ